MKKILTTLLLLSTACFCDVRSTTGKIQFDTLMDGQVEMTLNSTGLGIGVLPSSNLHVNGNAIVYGQIIVGGGSGSSNLNINGTLGHNFETVTTSTTLSVNSVVFADTSTGNILLSLPEASSFEGRKYTIKKISTLNSLFIRDGGFIDDYSDISLSVNNMGSVSVISSSGNWHILNISGNGGVVTSENLIGWWKLDETSGSTAFDSSGLSNHGSLSSGFSFSSNSVSGKIGTTLQFSGMNEGNTFINVPNSSSLASPKTELSVTFWIKDENVGSSTGYLAHEDNNGWAIEDRRYTVFPGATDISANRNNFSLGTDFVNDSNWNHMAFTRSDNLLIIYKNGELSQSTMVGTSNTILTPTNSLTIGFTSHSGATDRFLKGRIDDIRVYNKALTDTEIQSLYNQAQ